MRKLDRAFGMHVGQKVFGIMRNRCWGWIEAEVLCIHGGMHKMFAVYIKRWDAVADRFKGARNDRKNSSANPIKTLLALVIFCLF